MSKEKYTYLATKNGDYIKDNEKKFLLDVEEVTKLLNYYEHRLSNCIEPKFNLNSIVCYVSKKTGVVITHCTIDKIKVVGAKERFFTNLKFQYKLTYNKRYFDEDELFATEEDALKKLEELKK